MAKKDEQDQKLCLAFDQSIEGEALKAGTVVGTLKADGSFASTHATVTRGHIVPRLADGRIVTEEQFRKGGGKVAEPSGGAGTPGDGGDGEQTKT